VLGKPAQALPLGGTNSLEGEPKMGMISEFKEFAMKGNLVDMAVGFVMGTAFATVVTSFINDVFMPAISPVMGGIDMANLKYVMKDAVMAADGTVATPEVAINYGLFINALIAFIIVAFVMFMIIKGMNKAQKADEEAPAAPPANEVLLAEIRDLLARQNSKI
jgi:large conductance mechanosensitive channel